MTRKQSIFFIFLGAVFLVGSLLAFAADQKIPDFKVYVYADMARPVEKKPFDAEAGAIRVEMRKRVGGDVVETCEPVNSMCNFKLPSDADVYFLVKKNNEHFAGGLLDSDAYGCAEITYKWDAAGQKFIALSNGRADAGAYNKEKLEYFSPKADFQSDGYCMISPKTDKYTWVSFKDNPGGKLVDEKGFPLKAPNIYSSEPVSDAMPLPPVLKEDEFGVVFYGPADIVGREPKMQAEMRDRATGEIIGKPKICNAMFNQQCIFNIPTGAQVYFVARKNNAYIGGGLLGYDSKGNCSEITFSRDAATGKFYSYANGKQDEEMNKKEFPSPFDGITRKVCMGDLNLKKYFDVSLKDIPDGKIIDENKGLPLPVPAGVQIPGIEKTPPPVLKDDEFGVILYGVNDLLSNDIMQVEMRERATGEIIGAPQTCDNIHFQCIFKIPAGIQVYFMARKNSQYFSGGLLSYDSRGNCREMTFSRDSATGKFYSYANGIKDEEMNKKDFVPPFYKMERKVCMGDLNLKKYFAVSKQDIPDGKITDEKGFPLPVPAGLQIQDDQLVFTISVMQTPTTPGAQKTPVAGAVVKMFDAQSNDLDSGSPCITDAKGECRPNLPLDRDVYLVAIKDSRRFSGSLLITDDNDQCVKRTYKLDSVSGDTFEYHNGILIGKKGKIQMNQDNDGSKLPVLCMGTDQTGYKPILLKYGGAILENGQPLPIPEGAKTRAEVDSNGNPLAPPQPPKGNFPPQIRISGEIPVSLDQVLDGFVNDVSLKDVILSNAKILKRKKTKGLTGKGIAFKIQIKSSWAETVYADSVVTTCSFGDQSYRIQRGSLKVKPALSATNLFYEFNSQELKLVNAKQPFECFIEMPTFLRQSEGEAARLKTDANTQNNLAFISLSLEGKKFKTKSYSGTKYHLSRPFLKFQENFWK